MDLRTAISQAKHKQASNIVGLRIYGRQLEVYRTEYDPQRDQCRLHYREDELFHGARERGNFDANNAPMDASELEYFVAPLSAAELDAIWDQEGEMVLHRLLKGAPDPLRCNSPREKAAFTSWCISALATHAG